MYPSTTWELLTSDKYIRTGNTPLSTGGNNSVSILKENLPNAKLQVESFNLTRGTMNITGATSGITYPEVISGAFSAGRSIGFVPEGINLGTNAQNFDASKSWTGTTSNASPYTNPLGSGTPLNIQPAYITLKFWKRLS